MPKLSALTDYDPMGAYVGPVETSDEQLLKPPSTSSAAVDKIINALFRPDENRLQLWPEKVVREALSAAPDVMSGKISQWTVDPATGELHTNPQMVEKAQSMAALAGTGGLAGTTEGTLGATPFLRPALKYKDRLYKGKEGQQHLDIIPENLYPEFQKMAMNGEDISHYNFGFVNDKGHFLDREKALKYAVDTGLVDKFSGQYGALTSTMFADSSKPGMAIEALNKSAPTFFSAVEHNVAKIPQAKMTGEQWLGTLSNKPGVKPEEMDWTGLKDFLSTKGKEPVTKAQIEQHLAANKIELKEVNKGGITERDRVAPDEIAQAKYKNEWDKLVEQLREIRPKVDDFERKLSRAEWEEASGKHAKIVEQMDTVHNKMVNETVERMGGLNKPTKYHSYQLPGGENYREMLLTLPQSKLSPEIAGKNLYDNFIYKGGGQTWEQLAPETRQHWIDRATEQGRGTDFDPSKTYRSSHWDEPNILAHVRMNDRDVGGKKSLHLEEIQSDWHQQGRDRGYAVLDKDYNKINEAYNTALKERQKYDFNSEEYKNSTREVEALGKQLRDLRSARDNGVPDAPFKKNWHELALKRMIREASEKGYDRLSWTPGEAQAARYDLSKQIGALKATPIMDQHGLKYEIRATNPAGTQEVVKSMHTAEELPNVVGKEMAKKIIEESEGRKPVHYKGLDLKIGGEGMKGFYDQIIPKALEKLGKEYGVKVKKYEASNVRSHIEKTDDGWAINDPNNEFEYLGVYKTKAAAEKAAKEEFGIDVGNNTGKANLFYIDIPQSLKDTALHKGFPLFSNKYMFVPVDYEPEFK